MTMLNQWKTTESGARYCIVRDKNSVWNALRNDGHLIYRASFFPAVEEYMANFGDVIEPAPRCICDGGSYETKAHPFIVNPGCEIHGTALANMRPKNE